MLADVVVTTLVLTEDTNGVVVVVVVVVVDTVTVVVHTKRIITEGYSNHTVRVCVCVCLHIFTNKIEFVNTHLIVQ